MSDQERQKDDLDADLQPGEEAGDAEQIAADQFTHGLLSFLHHDSEARQGERIDRLMGAIEDRQRPAVLATLRRPLWRGITSLAACLLVAFAVVYLVGPGEKSSAYALVQASLDAGREAGDRRYEVSVQPSPDGGPDLESIALLDLRGDDHVLLRADTPDNHTLIVGKNSAGKWAIRLDGGIERFRPERAWPRWINLGESTVLVESVDDLLARLDGHYKLTHGERETLADDSGWEYERITATLKDRNVPEPQRIELWIDPETHLVHRLEVAWPDHPGRRQGLRGGPERGGEGGPPHRDRPPPDEMGPPPDEMGPPGAMPPRRGPPRGGKPPHFLDGPPHFEEGIDPGPPELVVFQLIETDEFPADWFDPERHLE
ncbi:MAG: hypothetical protein ACF8NJ_04635 [Phycisphaerales bacterium JB038]